MDVFTNLFLLLFALIILISAASEMVESSIYIAKKLNIPKAIIGATILAYGTSSPEILVSLQANLNNEASIALGNVIGSNIANVCVGMGILYFYGIKKLNIKPDFTISILFLILSTFVVIFHMSDGVIAMHEGFVQIGILIALNVLLIREARNVESESQVALSDYSFYGYKTHSLSMICLILIFSIIILIFSSNFVVIYAIESATLLKIDASFIGLSIIAVGTSLPEILVTIASIKKKEFSIAIGNIVGSNILNMLAVLGIPALFSTFDISSDDLNYQMIFLFLSSLLIFIPFIIDKFHKTISVVYFALYLFTLYYFGVNA